MTEKRQLWQGFCLGLNFYRPPLLTQMPMTGEMSGKHTFIFDTNAVWWWIKIGWLVRHLSGPEWGFWSFYIRQKLTKPLKPLKFKSGAPIRSWTWNLLIRRRFRAANRQFLQGDYCILIGNVKRAAFCGLTAAAVRWTTNGLQKVRVIRSRSLWAVVSSNK